MDANPANLAKWTVDDGAAFVHAQAAEMAVPPEKRPLFRELPAAMPFPIDALGPLAEPARAIHSIAAAPLSMCGQSVLAAVTLAVQAHRDVELPGGGRRPLTCILLSVAESGERKSTVDKLAGGGIASVEEKWRLEWHKAQQAYEDEKDAYEATRAYAKRANKGDRNALQIALAALGPAPVPPPLFPVIKRPWSSRAAGSSPSANGANGANGAISLAGLAGLEL